MNKTLMSPFKGNMCNSVTENSSENKFKSLSDKTSAKTAFENIFYPINPCTFNVIQHLSMIDLCIKDTQHSLHNINSTNMDEEQNMGAILCNKYNILPETFEEMVNLNKIFTFYDDSIGAMFTRDSDDLSSSEKETVENMMGIMNEWTHAINVKHGFPNFHEMSEERHWSHKKYLEEKDVNYLLESDLFLFLLWNGEKENLKKTLSADRYLELKFKTLCIYTLTMDKLVKKMKECSFNFFLEAQSLKTSTEEPFPESKNCKTLYARHRFPATHVFAKIFTFQPS